MLYLAIDIGSSFIKSALLDTENKSISDIRKVPSPKISDLENGRCEVSLDEIAAVVLGFIKQYCAQYCIDGVLFSAQMHGVILFDEGGKPLTNFVTWQDTRAAEIANQVHEIIPKDILARTGSAVNSSHSVCMLKWFAHRGIFGRMTLLGEAVLEAILGHKVPMHETMAASTGMYDIYSRQWSSEIIKLLGLEKMELPEVDGSNSPVGHLNISGRDIPVYAPVGDQQACVLGTFLDEHELMINIATGSQLICLDKKATMGNYEMRPYFEGGYYRTIAHLPSGRSLNVLFDFIDDIGRRLFGNCVSPSALWKLIDGYTEHACRNLSLEVNTSFYDSCKGSIQGIDGGNLRFDNIFAAAYENMAGNYAAAYRRITEDGYGVKSAILSGGIANKSKPLCDMIRERFDFEVELEPYSEDAMAGLLRLACLYSGKVGSLAETTEMLKGKINIF